jgi:hypothetical protein
VRSGLAGSFRDFQNSEDFFAKRPNAGLRATYPLDRCGASKVEQVLRILIYATFDDDSVAIEVRLAKLDFFFF